MTIGERIGLRTGCFPDNPRKDLFPFRRSRRFLKRSFIKPGSRNTPRCIRCGTVLLPTFWKPGPIFTIFSVSWGIRLRRPQRSIFT